MNGASIGEKVDDLEKAVNDNAIAITAVEKDIEGLQKLYDERHEVLKEGQARVIHALFYGVLALLVPLGLLVVKAFTK